MADEKKPGFFSRLWAKAKSSPITKVAAGGVGVGAGLAIGGAALGLRAAKKSMFALHGRGTFFLLIAVGLLHFRNVTRGVGTFSLNDGILWGFILVGIIAGAVVYRDPDDPYIMKTIFKFVLLAFATYALPLLIGGFIPDTETWRPVTHLLMIWTPLFVLFIFANPGDFLTRWLSTAYFVGLSIYIIFSVVFPMIGDNAPSFDARVLTVSEFKEEVSRVWGVITKVAVETPKAIVETGKKQLNNTAPELFVGQVEQSQGAPLGVYFTDTRPLFNKFRVDLGDSVIVTTTMRSRTLAETYTRTNNVCWIEAPDIFSTNNKEKQIEYGRVNPANTALVYSGDVQDFNTLECELPNSNLSKLAFKSESSTADVWFNITYNFTTTGYNTYAFMDKDLFYSLRLDGKDPARTMGLESSRQLAKYTPGPVKLGMASDSIPFPYEAGVSSKQLPPFGITFSNSNPGLGAIQNFTDVMIYIPAQFTLPNGRIDPDSDEDRCTPDTIWLEDKGTDTQFGTSYRAYKVVNLTGREREDYVTVRCPLSLTPGQDNFILSATGWASYTFLVQANYTYTSQVKSPVQMTVKRTLSLAEMGIRGQTMEVGPSKVYCDPTVPPYISYNCVRDENASTGSCMCLYNNKSNSQRTSQDLLSICMWNYDKDTHELAGGATQASCPNTASQITAACANQARCVGNNCSCYVNDEEYNCYTWTIKNPITSFERKQVDYDGGERCEIDPQQS